MNLLQRQLTPDEIEQVNEHLKQSSEFSYSIMEGGYISNDHHVIFCTDREPYVGMLMPLRPDSWVTKKIKKNQKKFVKTLDLCLNMFYNRLVNHQ